MKKSTKIILTVLGSMLIVGFFTCLITLAVIDFDYAKLSTIPQESQPIQVDKQLSILDGASISIDVSFSDVHIGVSSDEMVHITYYETDQRTYEFTQDDDEITLLAVNYGRYESHRQKTWWDSFFYVDFSNNWEKNDVRVLIPSQFTGALSIDTSNGSIRSENISTKGNIFINTSFGAINLGDVRSTEGTLSFKTSNGNISTDSIFAKGDILATTSFGRINLTDVESSDGALSLKASNGNITADTILVKGNILASTSFGKINLTKVTSTEGRLTLKNSNGSIRTDALSVKHDILASTTFGKITMSGVESSDGGLSLTNSNGDIYVDTIFTKEDISTSASFGKIHLTSVKSTDGTLTIKNLHGNITSESIFVTSISLNTSHGSIQADRIFCTDIKMETNQNIEFSELDAQNITIDSSYGNVRGSIVGSESDFSVASRTSGRNNLPRNWGSGSKTLDVFASSGNIDVSFTE